MIYKTINKYEFRQEFINMERADKFSLEGSDALFEYLDEGEDLMELDVIALCCDFTEFNNLDDYNEQYAEGASDINAVEEKTLVIKIPNSEGFIIQNY